MAKFRLVLDPHDPAGQFDAVNSAPRWVFMKLAKAQKSNDGDLIATAMYDAVMACVQKHDRERLDEYLVEEDSRMDLLEDGLSKLMEQWTSGVPLEDASSSSESSSVTKLPTRHVSLSRGTVELEEVASR